MPSWPAGLPAFQNNIVETRQAGAVRTEMSAGPSKSRPRFSAVSKFYQCRLILTEAQRTTFDNFYESLGEGAATFTMPDPTIPSDTTNRTFRFKQEPRFTVKTAVGGLRHHGYMMLERLP